MDIELSCKEDMLRKERQIFFAVIVKCENENCVNGGRTINVITDLKAEDEDMWFEAFGHGTENSIDICVVCGKLGVADILMRYVKI